MINGIPAYGAILPESDPQEMPVTMAPGVMQTVPSAEFSGHFPPVLAALYDGADIRERLYLAIQPVIDPLLIGQPALFYELLSDLCLLIKPESDPDIIAAFSILSSLLENTLLLLSHKNLMIKV